jgi:hypothetical protein
MAERSICQDCFHSYVCEQFNENKDDNNKKCHFFNNHFVPTADVVEVVRCKDCKSNPNIKTLTKGMFWCRKFRAEVHPNDFCSYGERKQQ